MTDQEKRQHCVGCHDDFYNHGGGGSTKCWSMDSMELIKRKEVSIDQRPPWTQGARLFPNCYHRPRFVYKQPGQTQ